MVPDYNYPYRQIYCVSSNVSCTMSCMYVRPFHLPLPLSFTKFEYKFLYTACIMITTIIMLNDIPLLYLDSEFTSRTE